MAPGARTGPGGFVMIVSVPKQAFLWRVLQGLAACRKTFTSGFVRGAGEIIELLGVQLKATAMPIPQI